MFLMFVVTTLKVKYICYDQVTVSLFHESYPFHISNRPFIFKHLKPGNCTVTFNSRDRLTAFEVLTVVVEVVGWAIGHPW